MGTEQSGKAYFSLRPLNINLRDLFISPDVHCKVNCISFKKKKVPLFYSLSSSLVNCSFLISEASEDDLFRNSGFRFSVSSWINAAQFFFSHIPGTQNAAAVIVEEHCFCSSLFLVYVFITPRRKSDALFDWELQHNCEKKCLRVWKNLIERINKQLNNFIDWTNPHAALHSD